MKLRHYLAVLLALTTLYACDEETNPENTQDLAGTWRRSITSSIVDIDDHTSILDLTLNSDSTFSQYLHIYSRSQGQATNELAHWEKWDGTLDLQGSSVNFIIDQYTWWSESSAQPTTEPYRAKFYTDCEYTIENDSLTLSFTYYPADAPEPISLKFAKLE